MRLPVRISIFSDPITTRGLQALFCEKDIFKVVQMENVLPKGNIAIGTDLVIIGRTILDAPNIDDLEDIATEERRFALLTTESLTLPLAQHYCQLGVKCFFSLKTDMEVLFANLIASMHGAVTADPTAVECRSVTDIIEFCIGGKKPKIPGALTPRERNVLISLAEGLQVKEIATISNISHKTVETQKFKLMGKLGIHNKAGLVRYAIENGYLKKRPDIQDQIAVPLAVESNFFPEREGQQLV